MSLAKPSKVKSILVRAPNWIGDQILAYPFYFHLKKSFPKARIGVICTEWVADIQFKDCVKDVFSLPPMKNMGAWQKFRTLSSFAAEVKEKGPWDWGISLPNSISSAFLLWKVGVKNRVGYAWDGRSVLLNHRLKWNADPAIHRSQAYLSLLAPMTGEKLDSEDFWTQAAENELDPPIPGELDRFEPKKSWPEAKPMKVASEKYWVLAPGATAESRRWPPEYFLALTRMIFEKLKIPGVIVGGPSEVRIAQDLVKASDGALMDLTSQGTVAQLWSVFEGAQFTICNESGLAHLASLCGSPVQIVCGAANPNRTAPLGPGRVRVSINPVDCWPCERNTCHQPEGSKIKCLKGIEPQRVFEEVLSVARIRLEH